MEDSSFDESECTSSTSSEGEDEGKGDVLISTATKTRRFSAAQLACLNAYFKTGMKGVGDQYASVINRAAADTQLTVQQVKVVLKFYCWHV